MVAVSGLLGRRRLMPVAVTLLTGICLNFLLRHHPGAALPSVSTELAVVACLLIVAAIAALYVVKRVSHRVSNWAFPVVVALASTAVLLPPLQASRALTLAGYQDSGTPGRRPAAQAARLSAFLRAERRGARYEVATHGVGGVSALIVRDGLPVLFLSNLGRQPLLSLRKFISLVRAGQVHAVLVGACPPRSRSSACDPTGDWTRRHGRDVSAKVGLPAESLYQVQPPRGARARGSMRASSG